MENFKLFLKNNSLYIRVLITVCFFVGFGCILFYFNIKQGVPGVKSSIYIDENEKRDKSKMDNAKWLGIICAICLAILFPLHLITPVDENNKLLTE